MLTQLLVLTLTLALTSVASMACAQSTSPVIGSSKAPEPMAHREFSQAMAPVGGGRHKVT